jgi:hypothetical protein
MPPVRDITEFHDLVGCELSGVCFVRDYVELLFDGPIVRCFADPKVVSGEDSVTFPEPRSRDALCELIGATVARAEDRPDRLRIALGSSTVVEIPKESSDAGPEVAHFVPTENGRLDVARMMLWENLRPTR